MTQAEWITLILFGVGCVGTLLGAQHKLITSLLKDRWTAHEALHREIDARLANTEDEQAEIALKVNTLETLYSLRGAGK